MHARTLAVTALVAAMILVGSSVAVGRILAATLPIHFASMVRFALASLVLVPLTMAVEGRFPRIAPRTLAILAAQSLCGSFLFTVCLLKGLRLTGAADAGVVAATTPAMVALLGWLLFRERPGRRALAGIVLTVAGVAAVNAAPANAHGASSALIGNGLVGLAVVFEAAFLLLRRAVDEPLSPLAAAMWVSLLGFFLFLIPGLWQVGEIAAGSMTPWAVAELAYYGLGVTAAAYMLWFYGVVRVEAATAGVVTGVMPVAALAFAAWLCGEGIGVRQLVGCAGVLAGIAILSGIGRKRRPGGNLSCRKVLPPGPLPKDF
ncbi:DMT family transporter [Solidesulfovibrio sp. C21]|uniref:DMT family transporter n=1 Tax=Solidesulfovibrio sp. C21 TaxID=3398613 RepID=UPI0039FD2DD1